MYYQILNSIVFGIMESKILKQKGGSCCTIATCLNNYSKSKNYGRSNIPFYRYLYKIIIDALECILIFILACIVYSVYNVCNVQKDRPRNY